MNIFFETFQVPIASVNAKKKHENCEKNEQTKKDNWKRDFCYSRKWEWKMSQKNMFKCNLSEAWVCTWSFSSILVRMQYNKLSAFSICKNVNKILRRNAIKKKILIKKCYRFNEIEAKNKKFYKINSIYVIFYFIH